jgi:hypothetical protein
MTKGPGANGTDLAADLLADLARSLPSDRLAEPPKLLSTFDSLGLPDSDAARGRRPALEGSVRLSPLDWRKPCVSVGLRSAAISFGPVRAELGIRVGWNA